MLTQMMMGLLMLFHLLSMVILGTGRIFLATSLGIIWSNAYINGSQVYDYLFMLSGSWYYNVGVLCHEFGHVLGAPDYYHYDGGGAPTPVGGWDVMASNGNPPVS